MPDAAQLLCSSAQLQRHRSYMFRLHTACSCLTLLCLRLLHLLPEILELMQWRHHLFRSIINILFFFGKYSKHGHWGIKSLKSMVCKALDYKWSIQHFVLAMVIQIGWAVGWKSALEPMKVAKIDFVSSARELLMHTCLLTEAFVPGVQWRAGSIPDDNHLWQTFLLHYLRCWDTQSGIEENNLTWWFRDYYQLWKLHCFIPSLPGYVYVVFGGRAQDMFHIWSNMSSGWKMHRSCFKL